MRPNDNDVDEEIRGHLAISIKERIERGEDAESARLAALKEFGNVTLTREAIRSVWRPPGFEALDALARDVRFALRSLLRARGLTATVIITLALGIGANAAIFSVVRGVLLRPLVNRDEDRLVYIRQSAPGIGAENTTFSVPEIQDLKAGLKSISALGDFSTITFNMVGLGEPRQIRAGVVSGSYFDVMGLRPARARRDARIGARGAAGRAQGHGVGASGNIQGVRRLPRQRRPASGSNHGARTDRAARPARRVRIDLRDCLLERG